MVVLIFRLDADRISILYRFSRTSQASLEEKWVSVKKKFNFFSFFTFAEDR